MMPRRPVRDWYSTEEAAQFIGVSVQRFRDFMTPQILPHSEQLPSGWLHYLGDLEKLKREREKNPPHAGRKKVKKTPAKKATEKKAETANTDSD